MPLPSSPHCAPTTTVAGIARSLPERAARLAASAERSATPNRTGTMSPRDERERRPRGPRTSSSAPSAACRTQPIDCHSSRIGICVASRMRREASAAARRIVHDAASAISVPATPTTSAQRSLLEQPLARPTVARIETAAPPTRNVGTPMLLRRSASTMRSPSIRARRSSRRSSSPAAPGSRAGRRGCAVVVETLRMSETTR